VSGPTDDVFGQATAVLTRAAELVAPAIDAAVGRLNPELHAPVRHHMAGGGKRVRAGLVLVSAAAAGGDEQVGLPGAVAIELVHNYSLIHDDIMDDDRERRHRPTVWAEFGVGRAIIAGDALAALATQVLLDDPTPERVAAAVSLTWATQEMIAGQADDMAFEERTSITLEESLRMTAGKTGALLGCASSLGSQLAGAPEATVEALSEFGQHLGIAFQAVDDVLGIWGDPTETGKPAGNDLLQHKLTIPVVMALEAADHQRDELETLLAAVESADGVGRAAQMVDKFGGRTGALELADDRLQAAMAALDRVDLAAAPKQQLEAIAQFVTERNR
jgi:geranylgeranyl diphosphate synthase, type I